MRHIRNNIVKQVLGITLCFPMLLGMVSCKDDYSEEIMEEVQFVTEVKTDVSSLKLAKGMKRTIQYVVLPDNAYDKVIKWKSSSETVATVTQDATISAKEIGKTAVSGISLWDPLVTINIEVVPLATAIQLEDIEMYFSTAMSMSELTNYVTVTPDNGYKENFDVESSNTSVVTIENGNLKAVGEGRSRITITSVDGSNVTASADITVIPAIPPTDITITEGQEFALGETTKLDFTLTPSDATVELMEWKSSDESIVTINERGYITANGYGTVGISGITPDGKEVKASVSVVKGKINYAGDALSEFIPNLTNSASGEMLDGHLVINVQQNSKWTNLIPKNLPFINADTYPIIAVKTNGTVKGQGQPNVIWHNIDLFTDLNTTKVWMVWDQVELTNDNNHVYYVDLSTIENGIYKGKGEQQTSTFNMQTGYDQNGGPVQTELSVYWIKSFKSLDDMKNYINQE